MSQAYAAVVNCQANRPNAGNVLYLYFPTATDSNFPDDPGGWGISTSPLEPFDVDDLDPGIGTTAQLRAAITERVKVDYCEFDMRVVETTSDNGTTNPTPSDPRWQVIGIGSDTNPGLFGTVSNWDFVNPNDSEADGFRITVLVLPADGTPSKGSMYTGGLSPWGDVDITADGSEVFKGTNYDRFNIDFVSPKSWNTDPMAKFQPGRSFMSG